MALAQFHSSLAAAMRLRIYVTVTIVASAVAFFWALVVSPPLSLLLVGVLGLLSFLAEWLAFSIPYGGSVSLAFAVHYAAVLLGGPLLGAVVSLFGAVSPQDISSKKPVGRMAFNASQFVLSSVIAGSVYVFLGGEPLATAPQLGVAEWIWPALLAAPVQAASNMLLVGTAMALASDVPISSVWKQTFRSYLVNMFALTLLGLVLARLLVDAGVYSVALLVVPFMVARQTFRVYQQQSDAYMSTVKSLVAAMEAKDPYTHGHSERVADLARSIAERLGLGVRLVDTVTWAALLHDIGKIALPLSVLRKPGPLDARELAAVRSHPSMAADILAEIEFLEPITPIVASHHEWFDGTGYPNGVGGSKLPLGSRILAVADSYDAMTSSRPYRSALAPQEAIDELRAGARTQFDPACVTALVALLDEGVLDAAEAS